MVRSRFRTNAEESALTERIERLLATTFPGRPRRLSFRYAPTAFGNLIADYAAGGLVLRFVRERGREFLEVGTDPGRLIGLDSLLVGLEMESAEAVRLRPDAPAWETRCAQLRAHVAAVAAALAPARFVETRARAEETARRLVPWAPVPSG
jgi:hypothetical protein